VRPHSLDALAEHISLANPVSHVGKLYNRGADRMAVRMVAHLAGILEATCVIERGQRIDARLTTSHALEGVRLYCIEDAP
jgi:S-adenosylmethionine synthetase